MASLGEIVLKFGATGEPGETPLRFTTAPINLLVGPNNAGKSLMLRELSGVNPRAAQKTFTWKTEEYPPTRIVEAVHWHEETARTIQQEIIAAVLGSEDSAFTELKSRTWEQLFPTLDQVVPQLSGIRDELCAALFELASPALADWKDIAAELVRTNIKDFAPVVIGGAIILLQMTRISPLAIDAGASQGAEPSGPVSVRRTGPLTPEQATEILQTLEDAWSRCEPIFKNLGVDTQELSLTHLLDKNAFGGALLVEMAKNPLLNMMLAREPRLLESAKPTAAALEQVRRFAEVGGWLIDPEPLSRLASRLRGAYAQETWENPERRANIAKAVLYLDGMARLNVTRSAELKAYADEADEQPAILSLLKRPESMDLLRTLTQDALGGHLVLDMTSKAPKVIWRLAQEEPPKGLENAYSADAAKFHAAAVRLDERSDGIHAFAGMLAAILAKSSDTVFIDEPEAFLHPPLIRQFARQLCLLSREWGAQFFIATHSADLLETFVSAGAGVNIIRLTHDSERSTARLLNSRDLRRIERDPLLRSEATLSALFHDGAIVCEAAGDRVLYKEINERLLANDEEALDSCVFLNAQNWETIPRMVAPLRRMGVAAAAILDADVLFESKLFHVLDAAQVDKTIRDGWLKQCSGLREKLARRLGFDLKQLDDDSVSEKKKKKLQLKGPIIADLKASEKKIFASLRKSMAEYGVFIVPVGELEDWLRPLDLKPPPGDMKAKWLRDALDRLGQDPEDESYVRPADGDIWDFMRDVNAWILDPNREGTSPSDHQTE